MSSYSLDFPWIYEFFDKSVPVIMVAQPDATGAATIKNVLPNWIRTTPFLPNGYGCQHMKVRLGYMQKLAVIDRPIIVHAGEFGALSSHPYLILGSYSTKRAAYELSYLPPT